MKKLKALGVLTAALCLAAALPAAALPNYVGLDSQAVDRYYNHAALNISCSFGTHLNGPHSGLTEHFIHTGPLGYCGMLYGSTGDYHIIAVYYYMTSGGGTGGGPYVPGDKEYDGTDPRATSWNDIRSGEPREVTDWQDNDRNGLLSPGDQVTWSDGATESVDATGTAAEVERPTTAK